MIYICKKNVSFFMRCVYFVDYKLMCCYAKGLNFKWISLSIFVVISRSYSFTLRIRLFSIFWKVLMCTNIEKDLNRYMIPVRFVGNFGWYGFVVIFFVENLFAFLLRSFRYAALAVFSSECHPYSKISLTRNPRSISCINLCLCKTPWWCNWSNLLSQKLIHFLTTHIF